MFTLFLQGSSILSLESKTKIQNMEFFVIVVGKNLWLCAAFPERKTKPWSMQGIKKGFP